MYSNHNIHRLDTPPPQSQFRRPWSPDPNFPSLSRDQIQYDDYQIPHHESQPSDVSIQALDLADYAQTLRPQHHHHQIEQDHNPYAAYYPSLPPPSLRALPSRDSLPSLASRGGTSTSSHQSHSNPRRTPRRPFSLPPIQQHDSYSRYPHAEIDTAQFPSWSQNWYNSSSSKQPLPQYASAPSLPPTSYHEPHPKPSPFDPTYPTLQYPYDDPYAQDPERDLLPWSSEPPSYGPPIDASLKQERLRMLEREFGGPNNTSKSRRYDPNDPGADPDEPPPVGSVDPKGNLVTQGPKKRFLTRFVQILLAIAAAVPSIYAALVIKQPSLSAPPPPPQGTIPAYILYVLSVLTLFGLLYLFMFRSCCGVGRRGAKGSGGESGVGGLMNGMMVLPVPGLGKGGKGKAKYGGGKYGKKGKKGGGGEAGDVQVNLIVDPGAFGGGREPSEPDENEYNTGDEFDFGGGSVPGSFNNYNNSSRRKRHRPRRRSVFAGLAMEEQWRAARAWLKKLMMVDCVLLLVWAVEFVYILVGKRCPSGGFNGWCNAYNVSSAAACLLSVAFGLSVFFDIKDLSASRVSPRTKG